MIALTKQQKIRRQLHKLQEADLGLDARSQQDDVTFNERSDLLLEKIELERKKIGLAYDELKTQLKEWNHIKSGELWKLVQPKYAVHGVFFTDLKGYSPVEIHDVSDIVQNTTVVARAETLNVKGFLLKAVKFKTEVLLEKRAQQVLGDVYDPIRAYDVYKTAIGINSQNYLAVNNIKNLLLVDSLEIVAKKAGIHILNDIYYKSI